MNLILNFTQLCNSRCTTCNLWKIQNPQSLSLPQISKIFKWVPNMELCYVTGGEPYIHPDILAIAHLLVTYHPNAIWSTPTNAISRNTINKILEVRKIISNIFIEVSLEGNKEEHDSIRGVPGNYENALYLLGALKVNSIPCSISTGTANAHVKEVADFYRIPMVQWIQRKDERYNFLSSDNRTKVVHIDNCPGAKRFIQTTPDGYIWACEEYKKELCIGYADDSIETLNNSLEWVKQFIENGGCKPCTTWCYKGK